jgi:hypothetical protein
MYAYIYDAIYNIISFFTSYHSYLIYLTYLSHLLFSTYHSYHFVFVLLFVASFSPERPRFDLNFEVITKIPSDSPPFGTADSKTYRARRNPFVKHLSLEDKERYLFHLGAIKDSEFPELKKEITLMRKIEDLVGIKLEDLKPKH